jgi:hypothetical protein
VTFLHCLEENVLFVTLLLGKIHFDKNKGKYVSWFFNYDHESQNGAPMREIL